MVLVGLAILPHGCMILDTQKQDLPDGAKQLHEACVKAAKEVDSWQPDVIFLVTPHGFSLSRNMGIYMNTNAQGNAEWNGEWAEFG